jgi:hypothetical protein
VSGTNAKLYQIKVGSFKHGRNVKIKDAAKPLIIAMGKCAFQLQDQAERLTPNLRATQFVVTRLVAVCTINAIKFQAKFKDCLQPWLIVKHLGVDSITTSVKKIPKIQTKSFV